MKKIIIVIGTRPNFIKVTRFKKLVADDPSVSIKLVHTNQHFDEAMSSVFFRQFGIEIDHFIAPYTGSSTAHMGHIMMGLDAYFNSESPDLVIVVGDVNSTLAGAIAANKRGFKLAHLESGLRSRDRAMPEEINRILTDKITDYYFVTEKSGSDNLLAEGVDPSKIFFVGNTMIDTLVYFKDQIESSLVLAELNIYERPYALVTLHRPSNVDEEKNLVKVADFLKEVSKELCVVFPVHHRTQQNIERLGLGKHFEALDNCVLCDPLDYFSFQKLIAHSEIVITDSGGIQEETTFLRVPCVTLRENTERPVTIEVGTNTLMGFDADRIVDMIRKREFKIGQIPEMWDGHATERIMKLITSGKIGSES